MTGVSGGQWGCSGRTGVRPLLTQMKRVSEEFWRSMSLGSSLYSICGPCLDVVQEREWVGTEPRVFKKQGGFVTRQGFVHSSLRLLARVGQRSPDDAPRRTKVRLTIPSGLVSSEVTNPKTEVQD